MKKRKEKTLTKLQLKRATKDIEELEDIYRLFESGERPESLSEYKQANKMARWFNKTYPKYKKLYKKLPENLKEIIDDINPNEVGEFD